MQSNAEHQLGVGLVRNLEVVGHVEWGTSRPS